MAAWRVLGAVVVGLTSLSHCLAPTEIVVWLSTDVACSEVEANGFEIAVGAGGEDDAGTVYTSTSGCSSDGGLGSMVVLPSGGIGDHVGIRVVLGIEGGVGGCSPNDNWAGCIIARRELPFSPHEPLVLPIELQSSCLGNPCSPDTTCVGTSCVEAGVTCANGRCDLPDASAPPVDGGACVVSAVVNGPQTVAATLTPRITKAGNVYIVMWATPSGDLIVQPLSVAYGAVAMSAAITLVSAYQNVASMGPLGTDGVSTFAFTYGDNSTTSAHFNGTSFDGGVALADSPPLSAPSFEGMFWQQTPGFYVTATPSTANGSVDLIHAPYTPNDFDTLPLGTSPVTGVSLALGGSNYYLTYYDTACHVVQTGWVSGGFSKPTTVTDPPLPSACVGLKLATQPAWQLVAYASVPPALSVIRSGETTGTAVSTIPELSDFVPFSVAGAVDVAYVDTADKLWVESFGKTGASTSKTELGSITAAGVLQLDAVADDPTSTGYALVYVSGGVVTFVHVCQ